MQFLKRIVMVLGVLAVTFATSSPVLALIIGNPAHSFKGGDFAAGLGLGDNRYEFFGNIGLGKAGVLDVFLASEDVSAFVERDEIGIGYRHNLGQSLTVAGLEVQLGVLSQFRQGTISAAGLDLDFTVIDIGFGGFFIPLEGLNAYAAAVYERVEVEVDAPVIGIVSVTDTSFGFLVGVDLTIGEAFLVGAEIHPSLDDSGFIIYGLLRF